MLCIYLLCTCTICSAINFCASTAWAIPAETNTPLSEILLYNNDILHALILALLAILLLVRGIRDHKKWRIFAAFYVLLLGIETAFTMPNNINEVPLILWMPKLTAACLALFIFPLLGRMIMQTHEHGIADISLIIAAFLGLTPILAAFPHFNKFLYFLPLWQAYFLISILASIPAIFYKRPASLRFILLAIIPLLGLSSILFPNADTYANPPLNPYIAWVSIITPSIAFILQALFFLLMPSPRAATDTIQEQTWKKHSTHKHKKSDVKPRIFSIHDFEHFFSSNTAETTLPPQSELYKASNFDNVSDSSQNNDEVQQNSPTATISNKPENNKKSSKDISQQNINNRPLEQSQTASTMPHIMIVSSNSDNRQTWAYYLENLPYEISSIRTIASALQIYPQHPANIVILDGEAADDYIIYAVKQFRTIEKQEHYNPAFMLVLANNDAQGNKLLQSGCTQALIKPVSSKLLQLGIRTLIAMKKPAINPQQDVSQKTNTSDQYSAEQSKSEATASENNQPIIAPAPQTEAIPSDNTSADQNIPLSQKPISQPTIKNSIPKTKKIAINPKEVAELSEIYDSIRSRSQNTSSTNTQPQTSSGAEANPPSKDIVFSTSDTLNELYDAYKDLRARTPKTNTPQAEQTEQNEVNQELSSHENQTQTAVEEQKPVESHKQTEILTVPSESAPKEPQKKQASTPVQKSFARPFPSQRPNVVNNPEHKRTAIKVSSAPKILPNDTYFAPQPKPGFFSRLLGRQTTKQSDFILSGLSNATAEHLVGEPMPIISQKSNNEAQTTPSESVSIEKEPLSMTPTQPNTEQNKKTTI